MVCKHENEQFICYKSQEFNFIAFTDHLINFLDELLGGGYNFLKGTESYFFSAENYVSTQKYSTSNFSNPSEN